ncbi:MAG: lipid-A-disaccharide synthase [Phycisphaerales bacterium]
MFTAFEPSGDAHAATVIRALVQRHPEFLIYAWGGPAMEAAGATVIERTAEDGSMGLGALSKARQVRRHIKAIKRWSKEYRVVAHVPVDSPAANFPICKVLRKAGARTIHLVAPQLWAWGGWRKRKLRKRTNLLLCLLPFEEQWFNDRNIPARFIGHPMINRDIEPDDLHHTAGMLPQAAPKLAIFPGSRMQEVRKNIGLLMKCFDELQTRHADLCGIVCCARPQILKYIKKRFEAPPTSLHFVTVDPDVAVYWCDCALTVSGTMSLGIARQLKPMVGVYRVGWIGKLISMVMLRTKHRLLPNIVAGERIVPEFVPYAGGPMPIVHALSPIVADTRVAMRHSAALRVMCSQFDGHDPGNEAADLIALVAGGETIETE